MTLKLFLRFVVIYYLAMKKLQGFWAWLRADRKRLIGAGVIILLIIFGVSRVLASAKNKTTYQTATVTKGTIVSTISASGKAISTNVLTINTQATGVVKAVYVKDGDKVFAGQRIAEITLDSDGALANARSYASWIAAQNSYRSTQASLANVYDQIKGHATDESFAMIETRTKAEVANDNAYFNLAAAALSYQEVSPIITAPFSGTIGSVGLVEGMVLAGSSSTTTISSQRVAVIKGTAFPIVNVTLTEIDVPGVLVGQKATVTFDSIPDKTFTGVVATVDRIGSTVSNVTGYGVNIKLDTDSNEILPNMAASANIITQTKTDVLTIPSSAIHTDTNGSYVEVLRNGSPVEESVETGISSDTDTEITSGLTEGEVVVTSTVSASSATTTTTNSPFSIFGGGNSTFRGAGGGTGGAVRINTGGGR